MSWLNTFGIIAIVMFIVGLATYLKELQWYKLKPLKTFKRDMIITYSLMIPLLLLFFAGLLYATFVVGSSALDSPDSSLKNLAIISPVILLCIFCILRLVVVVNMKSEKEDREQIEIDKKETRKQSIKNIIVIIVLLVILTLFIVSQASKAYIALIAILLISYIYYMLRDRKNKK